MLKVPVVDTEFGRTVLVGNGPSATSFEVGRHIDSFDTIVRFNNFVIDGFEQCVGTRTTIWVRSPSHRIIPRNQDQFKYSFLCQCEGDTNFKRSVITSDLEIPGKLAHTYLSVGFAAIHAFSLVTTVYLWGFDFFQSDIHHYFSDERPDGYHQGEVERAAVERYVGEGRVRFISPLT